MNAPFLTRGGDGFDRRGFTVSDVLRMIEIGIIDEAEKFELLEGEIVPVAPESSRHSILKNRLSNRLVRLLDEGFLVATDSTLYLSEQTFVEPDICIVPDDPEAAHTPGPDVLLVVEVALTSIGVDTRAKAALYARHGIGEYWVVDAATLATQVHRSPTNGTYASIETVDAATALQPVRLEGVTILMSEIAARL
jgi:Uma2 family endonuclease